jgi:hypothetical protein
LLFARATPVFRPVAKGGKIMSGRLSGKQISRATKTGQNAMSAECPLYPQKRNATTFLAIVEALELPTHSRFAARRMRSAAS